LEKNDMSSWWEISFFATGDLLNVKELEVALPSLFHIVADTDRVGGGLIARVAQNYGGGDAMEAAIEHYPDLTFNGLMFHEQAQAGSGYSVFTGTDGEAEWREFSLSDVDRPMTPEEIEGEITRIDDKIAGLNTHRETCLQELRKANAVVAKSSVPVCGFHSGDEGSIGGRDAPEVAAIIARLKGKQ
jgi:hypothetical protein